MGWKALKEKFGIKHYVQITEAGICIGSAYVHDLVTINVNLGTIHESATFKGFIKNNYPKLLDTTSEEILSIINTPDVFESSITVYTYENGDIIEKKCEKIGWPNVTHDGYMMHENTYSTNKNKVVGWAKNNISLEVKYTQEHIGRKEKELEEFRAKLKKAKEIQAKLEEEYPLVE